jgi:mono/diheme cytochrome c family protein
MPIGLVVGAFFFGLAASLFHREKLATTAYHCTFLALLFWFPAVFFGLIDWQYFYHGASLNPIKMKLVLAGVMLVLLIAAVYFGRKGEAASKKIVLAVYFLAVITAVLLGWFGARLVYDGKTKEAPQAYQAGEKIFAVHCQSCHPGGGNVINPNEPLRGSSALKNPEAFISVIRNPKKPMPALSPSQLSDKDAQDLYLYVIHVLVNSGRQDPKP